MFKRVIVGVPEAVTPAEICAELGTKAAIRLHKGQGQKKVPTTAVLLLFSNPPPDNIYLGFSRFKIREYHPTPTRCFNCQRYGHMAKTCRREEVCASCGGHHEFAQCDATNPKRCANCGGRHSAGYRGCPKYTEIKQTLMIATKEKISYSDAVKENKNRKLIPLAKNSQTLPKTYLTNQNNQQELETIESLNANRQTQTTQTNNVTKTHTDNLPNLKQTVEIATQTDLTYDPNAKDITQNHSSDNTETNSIATQSTTNANDSSQSSQDTPTNSIEDQKMFVKKVHDIIVSRENIEKNYFL